VTPDSPPYQGDSRPRAEAPPPRPEGGPAPLLDRLVVLGRSECVELLAQARGVGRLAWATPQGPVVVPVNFAVDDGDIVLLSGEGAKLEAAWQHEILAFEIDSFDAIYHTGWSVLVQGVGEEVTDPDAIDLLRRLRVAPWAGGERRRFIRLRGERISGRRITFDQPHRA